MKTATKTQQAQGEILEHEDQLPAERKTQEVATIQPVSTEAIEMVKLIREAALNPDIDIERMKQLREFQKEIQRDEAEKIFNGAMASVQAKLQPVATNAMNDHTKSKYAKLGAIHKACKGVWTQEGFSVMSRTEQSVKENHVKVITTIRHSAGYKIEWADDWPMDTVGKDGKSNKTAIQGKGSSIQYARRYQECMAFDVSIDHEDKDGNGPENELSTKAADWIAAIGECSTMADLEKQYKDGYKELDKDGYGRNQLMKAKDAAKERINAPR